MMSTLRTVVRFAWKHRKLVAAVGLRLVASVLSRRKR